MGGLGFETLSCQLSIYTVLVCVMQMSSSWKLNGIIVPCNEVSQGVSRSDYCTVIASLLFDLGNDAINQFGVQLSWV